MCLVKAKQSNLTRYMLCSSGVVPECIYSCTHTAGLTVLGSNKWQSSKYERLTPDMLHVSDWWFSISQQIVMKYIKMSCIQIILRHVHQQGCMWPSWVPHRPGVVTMVGINDCSYYCMLQMLQQQMWWPACLLSNMRHHTVSKIK